MRTSCNGCRVLRKGCSENCEIRPCIEWIKSPESQANATLFLAKFYGRAGLLNLINAGERHQRPGIFKSLLYEACGRIVNPTFGSVGLLSSGNWAQCQAAVDAVLAGSPIVETNAPVPYLNPNPVPPVNSCDIRHVSKDTSMGKNKNRFTRSMTRPKIQLDSITGAAAEWSGVNLHEFGQSSSGGGERSMQSLESVEAPWEMMQMNRGKRNPVGKDEKDEVGLELTLGSGFGKLNGKQ